MERSSLECRRQGIISAHNVCAIRRKKALASAQATGLLAMATPKIVMGGSRRHAAVGQVTQFVFVEVRLILRSLVKSHQFR